jgi:hypothetical protein
LLAGKATHPRGEPHMAAAVKRTEQRRTARRGPSRDKNRELPLRTATSLHVASSGHLGATAQVHASRAKRVPDLIANGLHDHRPDEITATAFSISESAGLGSPVSSAPGVRYGPAWVYAAPGGTAVLQLDRRTYKCGVTSPG